MEALLKNSHGKPLKRLSPRLRSSEMYRKSQPSSAMAASDEVKFCRTMSHGLSLDPSVHWRLGSSPLWCVCICHGLLSLSKQSLQTCLWSISRVNMWRMIRFQSVWVPPAWHLDHLQQHFLHAISDRSSLTGPAKWEGLLVEQGHASFASKKNGKPSS